VDAIVVLVQVGQNEDWSDRGLPVVVAADPDARDADEAGAAWLADNDPQVGADYWRLLVWVLMDGRTYDSEHPDTILLPEDYRRIVAGRKAAPALRPRRRILRVPTGGGLRRVQASEELLGATILVTQDAGNSSTAEAEGPWYPAAAPGQDVVAARVYRVAELERGDRHLVRLGIRCGEVGWMPLGHGVIPVEEV
jgi:hypothetical protein